MHKEILVIDDNPDIRLLVSSILKDQNFEVRTAANYDQAVFEINKKLPDLAIIDIKLDKTDKDGIDLLKLVTKKNKQIPIIMISGHATVAIAVEATRLGAYEFIEKPFSKEKILNYVKRALESFELKKEKDLIENKLFHSFDLVGKSPSIMKVKKIIEKLSTSESRVLISGPTGTGKELVAREIHNQSERSDQPFVAVNCGALPENLIESELFGHCKGAFTGADSQRTGLFEMANHGTIMLDEIGELPKNVQAILLRVLESGEIRRVGDNQTFHVDVRVICATHRDLESMVQHGEFREDLLFRINPFEIGIPPLRDRIADISLLATHLYHRKQPVAKGDGDVFTAAALATLESASWKGNVRELANVIEHASILCDQLPIDVHHLPQRLAGTDSQTPAPSVGATDFSGKTLSELEMWAINQALERHEGNKPEAAKELGVSLKTLYNKLNNQLDKSA